MNQILEYDLVQESHKIGKQNLRMLKSEILFSLFIKTGISKGYN